MRKKPKIYTAKKCYELKDSALYNISTKGWLEKVLEASISKIKLEAGAYSVFDLEQGEKFREIQAPKFKLDLLHTRVASLLCRIKVSEHLHSGIKGKSNLSNAKAHLGHHPALTMDLRRFYPSVSQSSIFTFFKETMNCADDVAGILAELCCYKGRLPTGSRLSMPLSYWSNIRMFQSIQALCDANDIRFTLFVDDMTFSGESVTPHFASKITKIVESAGMEISENKTRYYSKSKPKLITGVIVDGDTLKVRNKHHNAIYTVSAK